MMCIIWPIPRFYPSPLPPFKLYSPAMLNFFYQVLPQLQALVYAACHLSSSFLCQTMTTHPSGPSLDKTTHPTRHQQAFLTSSVWVRRSVVNSQTPVFFPIKSHSTINAYLHAFVFH